MTDILKPKKREQEEERDEARAAEANTFFSPGPGFNNVKYGDLIASWGKSLHGEITVPSMNMLINALNTVLSNFNELMSAGKAHEIQQFAQETAKVIAMAKKSDDRDVQTLALIAEVKLNMIIQGLEDGKLSPEDIEAATAAAKEFEEKFGGGSGPIVLPDAPDKDIK